MICRWSLPSLQKQTPFNHPSTIQDHNVHHNHHENRKHMSIIGFKQLVWGLPVVSWNMYRKMVRFWLIFYLMSYYSRSSITMNELNFYIYMHFRCSSQTREVQQLHVRNTCSRIDRYWHWQVWYILQVSLWIQANSHLRYRRLWTGKLRES
jgi:hypothetical protein